MNPSAEGIFSPRRGVAKPSNAREMAEEMNWTASPVHQRATARAILDYLRLPSRPLPLAPATSPPGAA